MDRVRAVLYTRVSSDDQVQGLSLDTQEQTCREFAARNGFEVGKVFREEGVSGQSIDRPQLTRLLEWCRKHKPAVLVVYKVNRLARDQIGHYALRAHLRRLGVSLRSATEPIDESMTGELMEGILASIAQFDNRQRAQVSKSGMVEAARRGRWCWQAPVGYRNVREGGEPRLEVDEVVGPLMARAFELVSFGTPQSDVLAWLRSAGVTVASTTLSRALRSPVYMGRLVYDKWGIDTAGNWTPLVDGETWRKAQARLIDRAVLAGQPRLSDREEFPLRGLLRCGCCAQPLTASWSKGKLGKLYAYYHCPVACSGVRVRQEAAHRQFVALLEGLSTPPALAAVIHEALLELWTKHGAVAANAADGARRQVETLKARREKVLDAWLDGAIDRERFDSRTGSLDDEIVLAQVALDELLVDVQDVETCVAQSERFLRDLAAIWTDANVGRRRRFQSLVFPEGITVDARGALSSNPATLSVFEWLQPLRAADLRVVPLTPRTSNPPAGETGRDWRAVYEFMRAAA